MAVFDRLVAAVLALALVVLGVLVPIEIVHAFVLHRRGRLILPWETLTRFFTGHAWSTSPMLTISGLTAGIGLVLLLAELKRRRPALLTLATPDENVTAGATRVSVRQALAAEAVEVDGVTSASATIRRRRATVSATTGQRDSGDLRQNLTEHLTRWLEELGLVRTPPLRVRLSSKER